MLKDGNSNSQDVSIFIPSSCRRSDEQGFPVILVPTEFSREFLCALVPKGKGAAYDQGHSAPCKWAPWSEFRDGPTELVTAKIIFVEGASPNVYEKEVFKSIRLQIDPEVSSIFRFLAPGYQMQR